MSEQTYTNEQLHLAFYNYLVEKFDGDSNDADLCVQTAERNIPNTLNDYFGTNIASIYELTDTYQIEEFRKKIKANPVLKNLDMSEEPRYTEVLKWYRLFVKAINANSVPIPVPGEYQQGSDGSQNKYLAEGSTPAPLIKKTIFIEGEAGEALDQMIRKRNMQLRQACINYYKALHGGHLVCECCGFNFQKAYEINNEYIEIHHLFPFSHTDGEHEVNSETDLVPLCANCHRMIHHDMGGKGNCMSLEELKNKYKGIRYNNY